MSLEICSYCKRTNRSDKVYCQWCGTRYDEIHAANNPFRAKSKDQVKVRASRKSDGPTVWQQILAVGLVGMIVTIAVFGMRETQPTTTPLEPVRSQFSSPGVDHAGEMETCKQEIEKLVASIVSWQWGTLTTFSNRRIRRATVSYVPNSGPARVDKIICTFDVPPVGNDFFIDR